LVGRSFSVIHCRRDSFPCTGDGSLCRVKLSEGLGWAVWLSLTYSGCEHHPFLPAGHQHLPRTALARDGITGAAAIPGIQPEPQQAAHTLHHLCSSPAPARCDSECQHCEALISPFLLGSLWLVHTCCAGGHMASSGMQVLREVLVIKSHIAHHLLSMVQVASFPK